jgi:molecular chaperone HtpG
MAAQPETETRAFETEVQQLLNLMVYSLYSSSEIFLRELISNASDATDKLRFEAIQDESLFEDDPELAIRVSVDQDAGTITVSDNGVGMTRDDVVENLGTIARSGTQRFLDALTGDQQEDAKLIGQFGVGFYSAFIVADRVEVYTRRAGDSPDNGVYWASDGNGEYQIAACHCSQRGTSVVLHVREDQQEFLDEARLREIIQRYSDHIATPILMPKRSEGSDEEDESESSADEAGEETVNSASALWLRAKNEISEDEYKGFYQHIAHDFDEPLTWVHNKVEGNQSYTSLLFIPKRQPFDLFDRDQAHGVKLYVRRVFIMDDTENLLPRWLRFVRGVVDSDDLPLNVSRELLQHNKLIDRIRGANVKRVLDTLEKLAKDRPEDYAQFWDQFGSVLKEGPVEDPSNKERIGSLLRFHSTNDPDGGAVVSLDDYISRMREGQKRIYYVTGDTLQAAKNSPHLELFRKKGIEVLLLGEAIDEWLVAHLTEYNEYSLQSIAKGELDLDEIEDESEREAQKEQEQALQGLTDRLKESLGERVSDVRVSHRLTESPACLVVADYEFGMHMRRMLKAAGHNLPQSAPALEINPDHAVIKQLNEGEDDGRFDDWAALLMDQAVLTDGGQLEDPSSFVRRLNELLVNRTQGAA